MICEDEKEDFGNSCLTLKQGIVLTLVNITVQGSIFFVLFYYIFK